MIKVNKIPTQRLEHFDTIGNSLGFLNENENLDLRCQIKENRVDGYYLIYNGHKVEIDSNGGIDHWHDGMYDINEKLTLRILTLD